jgi:acetyltransferase-like isoleucine patch superfamily enzyme
MISYLHSVFSLKRFFFKRVSLLAYWDKNSNFTKFSQIRRFAKLKKTSIGKYSRVNPSCKLSNTTVGNFTAIGYGSDIGLGRHPLNFVSTHSIFYKKNKLRNDWVKPIKLLSLPIQIGNDVWIGIKCIILDGVKIGDGAIVGAGSVVTKEVPPYAIVGGAPAKIIKYRFEPDVINRLLEIKWWNLSDEEILEKIEFFREPEITVDVINKYFK